MNKLKLACLVPLLMSGAAFATPSCDGFQIRVKNILADTLKVEQVTVNGAQITPATPVEIRGEAEQAFVLHVDDSMEKSVMGGQIVLKTDSAKTVNIVFKLENKTAMCEHTDEATSGDYKAVKSRQLNAVTYTIVNQ